MVCLAKDINELPVNGSLAKGSPSEFEDWAGVFLLLDGLDGSWLLLQPDVEGGGAEKGMKDCVFLGLGGSGGPLLGICGGRRGGCV